MRSFFTSIIFLTNFALVSSATYAEKLQEVSIMAQKGDAGAQYWLGLAYDQGLGVPEND